MCKMLIVNIIMPAVLLLINFAVYSVDGFSSVAERLEKLYNKTHQKPNNLMAMLASTTKCQDRCAEQKLVFSKSGLGGFVPKLQFRVIFTMREGACLETAFLDANGQKLMAYSLHWDNSEQKQRKCGGGLLETTHWDRCWAVPHTDTVADYNQPNSGIDVTKPLVLRFHTTDYRRTRRGIHAELNTHSACFPWEWREDDMRRVDAFQLRADNVEVQELYEDHYFEHITTSTGTGFSGVATNTYGFSVGQMIRVVAQPTTDADHFEINIYEGGNIPFHMKAYFAENRGLCNTLKDKVWGQQEEWRGDGQFPFKQGQRFVLDIIAMENDALKMEVDGKVFCALYQRKVFGSTHNQLYLEIRDDIKVHTVMLTHAHIMVVKPTVEERDNWQPKDDRCALLGYGFDDEMECPWII